MALRAYIVHFPVYRTYVTADGASTRDRRIIERTIEEARQLWSGPDTEIFDFLRDVVTLDLIAKEPGHSAARIRRFGLKLQQLTGPMMAKSFEDTALYRYIPVLALNEVGGHPHVPGLDVDEFHRRMAARASEWPHGLTATATHDTKRGEDARARLLVLSEMPEGWREAVARWRRMNEPALSRMEQRVSPAPLHEYLFYQSLLGAWIETRGTDFTERMQAYLLKAARESKTQTSWLHQDAWYEQGLQKFVAQALDAERSGAFLEDFAALARRVSLTGALNSLSQLTLKMTLPGVPDFYQGTELWDLSLVDPDNRRPVDFSERQQLLHEILDDDIEALVDRWSDGRVKFALTQRLLRLRNRHADLFARGDYRPILARGTFARHVIAFSRNLGASTIIVAVGRHMLELCDHDERWPRGEAWKDTSLELDLLDSMRDAVHERALTTPKLAEIFAAMPVAVLLTQKR
jgi:(1->4)-alpha-D-glucan 1-alpha-D-glucosylmutase